MNFCSTVMPLNTLICESAVVTRISDGFPGANCTTTFLLHEFFDREEEQQRASTWNPVIFFACDLRFLDMFMSI